jgi:CBS domain-containing protein
VNARDVMTPAVVSVGPDAPTCDIAKILRDNGISAVPVVDAAGRPSGMVSEGDLIGRDEAGRDARRDWWLTLLAEGETTLNADYIASLRAPQLRARDVMASPLVTVDEDAQISEIARLLTTHRIKRVPVLHDGRIVGIVSRCDLVRALAAELPLPTATSGRGMLAEAIAGLDRHFRHQQQPGPIAPPPAPAASGPTASEFRGLMVDHDHKELQDRQQHRQAAADQARDRVAELIGHHISDDGWHALLHQARQSAEQGEKELMMLRFPSQLCSDGGRAVNIAAAQWPETLRGEAAELHLRWERDLKPHGFPLRARILDFPGGMPGDIGLFLVWEQ